MKNGVNNMKLISYDDLFGTNVAEQQGKSVIEIDISELHEFPDHPFRFEMDAVMQDISFVFGKTLWMKKSMFALINYLVTLM